jgi:N-acetylglucosaminyldiphosphoundecaprenol N-acetyl-beta-D-mannosaminyltransferase
MTRVKLLGVEVEPLTMEDLHDLIVQAIADRKRWIIANHNSHSVYLFHRDATMRAFYAQADTIHIDGMPLIFLGRLLRLPLQRAHRVTYVDWIRPLAAEAARRGFRIFYLGSRPDVADRGAAVIRRELPALQIATHHGFFDRTAGAQDNERVLAAIRAFHPDILMVGMGMPQQEHWVLQNAHAIEAPVILTTGACMDYVAGAVPTPPRWMGRWGIEWLHRLASDPARLWKRYLIEPWFVLRLFIQDLFAKS